ncbi:hypothetical protein [Serratia sp. UGAL515B_01]|uniref:hypothetical protein n=1 Tax=Serratia sp. UGAL515B_01 TaxID=2986763 RepID=UPI00295425B3|nr:hypothetical protein [Serratia sp. UGAL515B_01]WON76517.1 hypothetical protein OK023_15090 [Serratia sp. UGAL515B_01]
MRWLFAMLIVLSCWASLALGEKICLAQTLTKPTALSIKTPPYSHVYRPASELRQKCPGKLLFLYRMQSYPGSLLVPNMLAPAYTLAIGLVYRPRPQRQSDAPVTNRLQQVNGILHANQQQSRIGGWKESNILYRGSLTYYL